MPEEAVKMMTVVPAKDVYTPTALELNFTVSKHILRKLDDSFDVSELDTLGKAGYLKEARSLMRELSRQGIKRTPRVS